MAEATITQAMTRAGLRPESWTARNAPYLVKCRNRRPTPEGGLKNFLPLTAPVSDATITGASETKDWPYPILFEGRSLWILAFADALYTVDPDTRAITPIDTKDPDDETGATSKAITAGWDWHFLDMGHTWMLFNGTCVVWQKAGGYVWVTDEVTIYTGCTHGAGHLDNEFRAVLAGFDPANFYARADWPAYWSARIGDLPAEFSAYQDTALSANAVRWTSLLGVDLLDLLDPDPLMETGLAIELRRRREAGARRMPWIGKCLGVAELGSGIVVYGTGGIHHMVPDGKGYSLREFPEMGPGVGIKLGDTPLTRTHWAGSRSVQFVVDGSNELWRLSADGHAKRLGYSEYLATLDRNNLLLAYDPVNDELYCSDGTACCLYTQGSMCFAPHMPNRIYSHGRADIRSIWFATEDADCEIETGTFTTKSGRIETLLGVRLIGLTTSGSDGWRVKVKYRLKASDDFIVSDEITPNGLNVAACILPVYQYRFVFAATDYTKVSLEDFIPEFGDYNASSAHALAATPPGPATE